MTPEKMIVIEMCEKRIDQLLQVSENLIRQFAYYSNGAFHTSGLSALEDAFDVLGWDDPHPDKEAQCQIKGCKEQATCGAPTKKGCKRMCHKHYEKLGIIKDVGE